MSQLHINPSIAGCRTSNKNIHHGERTEVNSHSDRRHPSLITFHKTGKHKGSRNDNNSARNLELLHHFGLGFQKLPRLKRMEMMPQNIPITESKTEGSKSGHTTIRRVGNQTHNTFEWTPSRKIRVNSRLMLSHPFPDIKRSQEGMQRPSFERGK